MTKEQKPVWFITGCSTGFGRELTMLLIEQGFRVVATARDVGKIADLVAGHGDAPLALPLDVTDGNSIVEAVKQAEAKFGQVDVLVNNAGYGYLAAIEEGEDGPVRTMFDTNVFGLIDVIKAVLPGMRERRRGHIINLSSIGGLVSFAATGYYHATEIRPGRPVRFARHRVGAAQHQGHGGRARTLPPTSPAALSGTPRP
jgi:NADP-dependent 3-hydroxy acid dehydrogenase YdfG